MKLFGQLVVFLYELTSPPLPAMMHRLARHKAWFIAILQEISYTGQYSAVAPQGFGTTRVDLVML